MDFTHFEWAVLSFLKRNPRWVTTNEIANKTDMAWETATDTLETLHKKGYVVKRIGIKGRRRGIQTFWKLYDYYKK